MNSVDGLQKEVISCCIRCQVEGESTIYPGGSGLMAVNAYLERAAGITRAGAGRTVGK